MKCVITTRHNKAEYLKPVLETAGIQLQTYDGFDTDSLGSFCNTVERKSSPESCALIKAKVACNATGADFGLGSEGSFQQDALFGFYTWNQEVLCFYNRNTEQTIYAYAEGPLDLETLSFVDRDCLFAFLERYPGQYWILSQNKQVVKGLSQDSLLRMCSLGTLKRGDIIAPDLRAMYCPGRQERLKHVARDLCCRLRCCCPNCNAQDFVVKRTEPGLPCAVCATPTTKVMTYISVCSQCGYCEEERRGDVANSFYCGVCNP